MIDVAEYYMVEAFKDICDEYLSNMKYDIDNISTFMDCENKYSLVKLRAKLVEYVDENFFELLEAIGLNAKKFELDYFFECGRNFMREEKLFEAIYNRAEKHASIKQNLDIIESAIMKNAIKEELSDFLPKFDFVEMSHKFLLSVVVTKCGFLFSHEDLGAILVKNYNNENEEAKMLQKDDKMSMKGRCRLLDFSLLQSDDENESEIYEYPIYLHDSAEEDSIRSFDNSNDSDFY